MEPATNRTDSQDHSYGILEDFPSLLPSQDDPNYREKLLGKYVIMLDGRTNKATIEGIITDAKRFHEGGLLGVRLDNDKILYDTDLRWSGGLLSSDSYVIISPDSLAKLIWSKN